jgi:hypothetical protein
MKDNSLSDKLNLYFDKNPNLDKSMIIRSLENLIEGKTLNTEDYKLLKSTGFFDIVYQLKNNNDTSINEIDLFKIRAKITKLFNMISNQDEINLNDFKKIFDVNYNNENDKDIKLDFEKYNDLITNKIFEICENKISKNKGKFYYSEEILNYLDQLLDKYNSVSDNNTYLKNTSKEQISEILNELNVDKSIININNNEELDLLQSVYHDSENIYFNNEESENNDTIINSEINDIKDKFTSILENYEQSSKSINFLIDNSKNLESNLVTLVGRLGKIEEATKEHNCKINTLEKFRQTKSKMDYDLMFNDIEKTLRDFKSSITQIENKNESSDKDIEILKSRLSILDSDLSKHKECVVNSFEIIEERLTQLFKSMIVVNNNIKHCFSNTEKMYTEITNKIR